VLSQLLFHRIVNEAITLPIYTIDDVFYHPIFHFNEFLIGNLAGLFFIKSKNFNTSKNYLPQIAVLFVVFLAVLKFQIGINFHNGFLALVFVPIIYLLSSSNDVVTRYISKKPFVFLGEVSYSIYILQVPVWLFLSDYRLEKYFGLSKELDITSSFSVRLFILILFSSLCYLYFEKPLRKKIKNYF
jgi:peptidoglycan/LPS O-acetylase OafA/YrhL